MFIIIELCLIKRFEKRYVTFGKCPFLCNKFRILLLIKKQWNHEAYLYRGIGSGRYMPVGFDQPVWRSIGRTIDWSGWENDILPASLFRLNWNHRLFMIYMLCLIKNEEAIKLVWKSIHYRMWGEWIGIQHR